MNRSAVYNTRPSPTAYFTERRYETMSAGRCASCIIIIISCCCCCWLAGWLAAGEVLSRIIPQAALFICVTRAH